VTKTGNGNDDCSATWTAALTVDVDETAESNGAEDQLTDTAHGSDDCSAMLTDSTEDTGAGVHVTETETRTVGAEETETA